MKKYKTTTINLSRNNKSQSLRNKPNKKHVEINKIDPTNKIKYTKVEYCPMISKMLKNKNMKIKSPIVFSFIEFLNLYEKLLCRNVCKQWNELIKQKLPFLGQENFYECVINNSKMTSFKKYINNSYKKQKNLSGSKIISNNSNEKISNDRFFFENSDQKFSKKKVLVKLISSKNFHLIKSKISLGEMTKAKNLADEEMMY